MQLNIFSSAAVVCEHYKAKLSCPAGLVVRIKDADYGRVDNRACRNGRYNETTRPMNPPEPCIFNVKSVVRRWYGIWFHTFYVYDFNMIVTMFLILNFFAGVMAGLSVRSNLQTLLSPIPALELTSFSPSTMSVASRVSTESFYCCNINYKLFGSCKFYNVDSIL